MLHGNGLASSEDGQSKRQKPSTSRRRRDEAKRSSLFEGVCLRGRLFLQLTGFQIARHMAVHW